MPKRFLKWLSKEIVKYFIVPSRALDDSLKSFGLRTFYLQHFIDLPRFHVLPLPENTNNILFVGYLHFSKGVHILLRAFAHVIKKIPSATLEIVGDGPYESELRRLSSSLRLDNHVRFCGSVPPVDIPAFYQGANVVVLPSIVIENSPLSVYEAMASARPVIGSKAGGIPDLVSDGENGYLFTAGDHEDLRRKIVQLLSDKEKSETMGVNGRRRAETSFSPQYHIDQYLHLTESLIR
jgi:glycosyltransferase involved in cell wall biosynthesis